MLPSWAPQSSCTEAPLEISRSSSTPSTPPARARRGVQANATHCMDKSVLSSRNIAPPSKSHKYTFDSPQTALTATLADKSASKRSWPRPPLPGNCRTKALSGASPSALPVLAPSRQQRTAVELELVALSMEGLLIGSCSPPCGPTPALTPRRARQSSDTSRTVVCARMHQRHSPVSRSHKRTVPSSLPLSAFMSTHAASRQVTGEVWPRRVRTHLPVDKSYNLKLRSDDPARARRDGQSMVRHLIFDSARISRRHDPRVRSHNVMVWLEAQSATDAAQSGAMARIGAASTEANC
mmetsp:Transcript_46300/g.133360  ORF Transcript_46300/g.133360 Transcript_46300/m.133360 type:complete len:295 (+) Transcript_46300:160-1044(+)